MSTRVVVLHKGSVISMTATDEVEIVAPDGTVTHLRIADGDAAYELGQMLDGMADNAWARENAEAAARGEIE